MLIVVFWQITVFQAKFDSPQIKLDFISSKIDFKYELPHELRVAIAEGLKS